jgi:phosphoribosylaminoimidazole-succinocarboxamide synthase
MAPYAPSLTNLTLAYQGKTRDTYDIGDGCLLIVATDRISTHNIVHLSTIPGKGGVLTALTVFWFTEVLDELPNHLVAYGNRIYDYLPGNRSDYPDDLRLRAIVVRKLSIIPVEFIFRGYLAGSLYDKFYAKGIVNPYDVALPDGLTKMSSFNRPVFTPTEKSDTDDPVKAADIVRRHHRATEMAAAAFNETRQYANTRGIEIIDGKFEIGIDRVGQHFIADEVATPDSSRFTLLEKIVEGQDPPWLDKQIARDEAERVWSTVQKQPLLFAPLLVHRMVDTYRQLFAQLTGSKLGDFQNHRLA